MTTAQPATPVRVIYAKLTSTGDYDVVAKTDNIELSGARSLAEKLLLGNVPHEAVIAEELAYLRPPEGGHLLIRYTTYNWKDANRGDAFMTDILWLNDPDFARARNNAFAVMPHSDDVFDVLATLPPVSIAGASTDSERARLQELAGEAPGLLPLLAGSLVLDPVLAIERSPVHRRLELFTLLLPPSLRPQLTWQTRAFRVPAHIPRVTVADAMHANLQQGTWSKVLPDVSLDVPHSLAEHLVREAATPDALMDAQTMYDHAGPGRGKLREEVVRLMGFVRLAHALNGTDPASPFDIAAQATGPDAGAMLSAVIERTKPADVQEALVRSLAQGGAGDAFALSLLARARARNDDLALHRAAARELVQSSRMPREDLAAELVDALAAAGESDLVVLFVGLDRRIAQSTTSAAGAATPAGQWMRALADAARSSRDLAAAQRLLAATAALDAGLNDAGARVRLCVVCRDAIEATLDRAPLSRENVDAMVALQTAASDIARSTPRLRECIPLVFADTQIRDLGGSGAAAGAASRLGDTRPESAQALLAASLLQRASRVQDPSSTETLLAAARAALEGVSPQLRENVRRILDESQVRTEDLVALEGGSTVLPLLGRSAEQATTTRDLLQAARDLGDSDEAVARLAAAVLTGRAAHVTLTRTHQAFAPLRTALAESFGKRKTAGREAAVAEVTLDLLAGIVDADAFGEIESAVLGTAGMTVRLRRLDRAVALCRAAEDETLYERLATAIESPDTALSETSRERLRDALGTGGVQRRLIQMLTGVVERGS